VLPVPGSLDGHGPAKVCGWIYSALQEIIAITGIDELSEDDKLIVARAEEALAKHAPKDTDALLDVEAALRRSNLRLDVARRYRKSSMRSPHSEE